MQDIQRQVSDARKTTNQYRKVDLLDVSGAVIGSAIGGVLAAYGAYTGVGLFASASTGTAIAGLRGVAATNATLAWLGGGALSVGGLGVIGGMAVLGGLVAGPALAILGAVSAGEMEEKLEKAKAYHSQVEVAVKKADVAIDNLLAVERVVKLFTKQITKCDALLFSLSQDAIATMKKHNYNRFLYSQVEVAVKKADVAIDNLLAVERVVKLFTKQITKCDALLFSLSQDAIATMKKHNYNRFLYNQEEKDQLCVTVPILMTLSAFLKVPIIDKDQKLQEKAQRALEIMKGQMDALESWQESGRYNVAMIQSRQKDLENL
ncbi:hypothetical protein HPSAT_02965 [Helicobacter pylori Sat464]|nr:hypothetical protein [Helicobacter pylori]ADO05336.1 hypothetical protein HPSAT_02965 [Helicobacter pylori Sat464]